MKTLTTTELVTVAGGTTGSTKANHALTTQVTALQTSLKDLAANKDSGSSDTMTMMMMALAMRPQSGPTVIAAAPSPIVNISNRYRR